MTIQYMEVSAYLRVGLRVVPALICFVLLAGCEPLDFTESLRGDDDLIRSIEQEVIFDVSERHFSQPADPLLALVLSTKGHFGCLGYRIRHTIDRTEDDVIVRALDIDLPGGICLTALGPASATIELPFEPGTYRLVLINGDFRDEYAVRITERYVELERYTYVQLEPPTPAWTEPTETLNWRYPPNSFAYYCGTLTEDKDLCTDFAARIEELPVTRINVPESGAWPYALTSQGHYYDAPARFYVYPDHAIWEKVTEELRTFSREHLQNRQGVGLTVRNWRWDQVNSWALGLW